MDKDNQKQDDGAQKLPQLHIQSNLIELNNLGRRNQQSEIHLN